ncbi:MAG: C4-type zinc ribbon domain-containing protein [Chloroflexi bacterium]|nr:C4-type zinc ribbon domain-containing protein [Chloroflexota bacterium]
MATIEALYRLQELELALKESKTGLAGIAARIERDEHALHAHALAVRAQRALAALEAEQAKLDGEVQGTAEHLKGLEQRLYSGSTAASKDLLALQREIAHFKERQGNLEEQLLAKMEQVETAQTRAAGLEAAYQDAESQWRGSLPSLQDEQRRLQQHAEDIAAARNEAEAALTPAELRGFRSLEASRGQAVARLERGMCGGCVIAVPSHEIQLMRSTHDPVRCPNCGRFLYPG